MLIDMIHELCEDGMPSTEVVKAWLVRVPNKEQSNDANAAECGHSEHEDYSNLKDGDTIYYVDAEDNKIVQGVTFGVRRTNPGNSVRYLSLVLPNDFMGCAGELLGDKVFLNKELAEKRLRKDGENV
jgi:hypothetical protein